MSLNIEDKIINHLISKYILEETFETKYIDNMVATRIGKGTSYGIKMFKKYLSEIKSKFNTFYVLKIDISKYFYSIDHEILKNILNKKIKDKKAINALSSIIDSTNKDYINKKIKYIKSIYRNKDVDNIPIYEIGKGVGIGNQTSQNFGLIYLYEINHYIKEKLNIKYLINYMDDFLIIHEDKEYLKYCLDVIKRKLLLDYKLNINEKKTRIHSIKSGVEFLGYRFYVNNNKIIIKVKKETKRKFKNKVKNLKLLLNNNYISIEDYKKYLSSYKGLLKYKNCRRLYYKTIKIIEE